MPGELSGTPLPPRLHLVEQEIETELLSRMSVVEIEARHPEGEEISGVRGGPAPLDGNLRNIAPGEGPGVQGPIGQRSDQDPERVSFASEVELRSIGVHILGFVVELPGRCGRIPEGQLRLVDGNGHEE
jgi:hypothetical protein